MYNKDIKSKLQLSGQFINNYKFLLGICMFQKYFYYKHMFIVLLEKIIKRREKNISSISTQGD